LLFDSCTWRPAPDRKWGNLDKDGKWTGMIGEVMAGRDDIIAANVGQTASRSEAVQFLVSEDHNKYGKLLLRIYTQC